MVMEDLGTWRGRYTGSPFGALRKVEQILRS